MVEDIQRQRTVFPSTSGPNMFDVAGPAREVQSLGQGRLPFFNEGRAGRGNYQGDPVFPAPFDTTVNEIPMGNRYPGSHTFYDVDKPYRQEAGLREQPPQGITSLRDDPVPSMYLKIIENLLLQRRGKGLSPGEHTGPTGMYQGYMNNAMWDDKMYDPSIVEELDKKGVGPMDLGGMEDEDEPSILDYYFNQPPLGAVDVMGRPTLPPEMYEDNRLADIQDDNEAVMKLYERGLSMEEIDLIMSDREMETTNLGNYDLFHLMQNGYSLEEAQQILNEQGLA